ncbi:MAG: Tol-Pal system beta propeller repeat protein TolB [Candidatus Competibacteraceae bacterium]|nr:Tol-Pal system beta propeller repeat protein TolB [Candidatus Competibacteraceae bacterium]
MKPIEKIFSLLILLFGVAGLVHAQISLDITKTVESGGTPIAIAPFSGSAPDDIAGIIAADLRRTGQFAPQAPNTRANYSVTGQAAPGGGRGYVVQFQLSDAQGGALLNLSFDVPANQLRPVAHRISDLIYEKLTGEKGLAGTRIAFVGGSRGSWFLVVADADGQNPQVILRSGQPIMSPAWSPDGSKLAYVSFEGRRSQIVVQDVYSGARRVVSIAPGINGAPAWSPNGQRLAFTLSKDGNPEIYALDLAARSPVRLTSNGAIDTEPVWLPDGSIVFTSDRGGSPQLYRIGARGGAAQRLTFEGDYNARPAVSPDGRYLAMMHRRGGRFHIAVLDLQTRQFRTLTSGGNAESPSFAPNGKMIVYSDGQRLAAVSVDGTAQQNLALRGRARDPAWSPYGR